MSISATVKGSGFEKAASVTNCIFDLNVENIIHRKLTLRPYNSPHMGSYLIRFSVLSVISVHEALENDSVNKNIVSYLYLQELTG